MIQRRRTDGGPEISVRFSEAGGEERGEGLMILFVYARAAIWQVVRVSWRATLRLCEPEAPPSLRAAPQPSTHTFPGYVVTGRRGRGRERERERRETRSLYEEEEGRGARGQAARACRCPPLCCHMRLSCERACETRERQLCVSESESESE